MIVIAVKVRHYSEYRAYDRNRLTSFVKKLIGERYSGLDHECNLAICHKLSHSLLVKSSSF